MRFNEAAYRRKVRPHLLRCRPGDWQHAQEAARWVKTLGKGRRDLPLLITAAYIHDLGYRGIFRTAKPITVAQILKHEPEANRNTKPFVTAFLTELNYTRRQIQTVLRLIHAADRHHSGRPDEAIIVDADQLCKLSLRHIKLKFKRSEWPRMLHVIANRKLLDEVRTPAAKALVPELLAKLKRTIRKQTTNKPH